MLPDSEKKNFINEIDLTTKNIYRFLEDLLEWSHLNMGSFKAKIEKLNLYDNVEEIINLLSYNARNKSIKLINELDRQNSAVGDPAMVKLLLKT